MDVFTGTICAFGFNFAPYQWAQCLGQLVPISQNTALFALLGTNYGGNGTTNFGLPDLAGQAAIGAGSGPGLAPYNVGEMGGAESVTLNLTNMPPHVHTVNVAIKVNAASGTVNSPVGAYPATDDSGGGIVYATTKQTSPTATLMAPITQGTIQPTGGGNPIDIRRPYLAMNYCIALQGIFPQRP